MSKWTVVPAEGDSASGSIGKGYWLTIEGRKFHVTSPIHAQGLCLILNKMQEELARCKAALQRIAKWKGEFPATGKFHDNGEPMSYSYCYGSNGERDFMRNLAAEALGLEPVAWQPPVTE